MDKINTYFAESLFISNEKEYPFQVAYKEKEVVLLEDHQKEVSSLKERNLLLERLFKLASKDIIFFSEETNKPLIIINDTFNYATADCEELPYEDIGLLLECYEKYDYEGIKAYVANKRGIDPIQITKAYKDCLKYLKTPK